MSESYLYFALSAHGSSPQLERELATFGDVAPVLHGGYLLAIDADRVDREDLHAGALLEALLDRFEEEPGMCVIEVNNIATFSLSDQAEELLDALYPADDDDDDDDEDEDDDEEQ